MNFALERCYLAVAPLDQPDKLTNHFCALSSKDCESLVLICEISVGSGVTGSLGVAGDAAADVESHRVWLSLVC